ncbi:type II secretion system protein [Arcobacter sp. CECT 8985]|uniref:type II secretion system protein n=1 Tax=Arcobacter sp. CECT 8985 TaxID=1935424 RepID=UPI00100BA047|nr:type II secretion system protein [Arcobacter sp. CECT 8985]RXJ86343.1 hypothetical protein CRU93_09250 [Arcobacter sp. CECT 8985]
MRKSFSLLELIFAIIIISITIFSFNLNKTSELKIKKIDLATNRLLLYLKQSRYQALIDDKYYLENKKWYKQRWTLKFFNCRNHKGIYYVLYSDKNQSGHPKKSESMKDPLTNKYIYSSNKCEKNSDSSKYVLLTKEFDINKVDISCKMDASLGKISFGSDGKVYKKLSNNTNESNKYEINRVCIIKLIDKNKNIRELLLQPNGGYIGKRKIE